MARSPTTVKAREYEGELYASIQRSRSRRLALCALKQPMTVRQIARETGLHCRSSGEAVHELRWPRLIECLNSHASRNRLYWLTRKGLQFQKRLRNEHKLPAWPHSFPQVDWQLYSELCFSHRSAVIRALSIQMRPPEVRRRACLQDPSLTMSCNNVRDVLRYLKGKGVVHPVKVRRKAHFYYVLTEEGEKFRWLLNQVGSPVL